MIKIKNMNVIANNFTIDENLKQIVNSLDSSKLEDFDNNKISKNKKKYKKKNYFSLFLAINNRYKIDEESSNEKDTNKKILFIEENKPNLKNSEKKENINNDIIKHLKKQPNSFNSTKNFELKNDRKKNILLRNNIEINEYQELLDLFPTIEEENKSKGKINIKRKKYLK